MKRKRFIARLSLMALLCVIPSLWAKVYVPGQSASQNGKQASVIQSNKRSLTEISLASLKIHYNFANVTNNTVADASGSGYNATLMNNASILEMGKYNVLNLGNGTAYLDMGVTAGNVLSSSGDHTVAVYYRVDKDASLSGNGFFLWAFSTLAANSATSGIYHAYRLNAQRFALSTGGYNNEKAVQIGGAAAKDTWAHIVYRQTGATGELYLNGILVGTNTAIPVPSSTFTTAPSCNWIGRAPFNGDNYLKNTLVYDFRYYTEAVSNDNIAEWAAMLDDLDYEYKYGTVGDFSQLNTYITQYNTLLTPAVVQNYPPVVVEEFKDAIGIAQDMVDANKASQFLIDDAVAALIAAYNSFQTKEGMSTGTPSPLIYDIAKGFKHPGALHTQEDFNRVKALLLANDSTAVAAYERLKANAYSQSNVTTYPVETIVRGGSGENYINAARGAAMAYQNALRWKISGDNAHAERAILILNSWATTCKTVTGDTNQSLASGLYGYEFANAAELMRDYAGWNAADFKKFQEWMLYLWYPRCIDFLRRRHETWPQGTPGHYWSNWGLCNALAVMSIGVLCDDVFIYNQGASFYKHDQVGNFVDNRTPPLDNNGLTEFIGNLVPAVHTDARGPYGYLGQMQESGRDQGHALMALGLAIDICQVGWSQGDDLFSLMDNRLAAGIEYVAAYNSGEDNLPWTEYWYHDVRTAWHNSWKMYANNDGGRYAFRPYWDRAIGHYEGVKGVSMPYSHTMKSMESIDAGGGNYGQTSGGFDHLGFSTLMSTRPAVTASQAPTLIIPTLVYNGVTYNQSELGGIVNTPTTNLTTTVPAGSTIRFVPTLPTGVTDTGNWNWDTGATTKELQITANQSGMYRVTYINQNGVKSTQLYSIAVNGDCRPDQLTPAITHKGVAVNDTLITVMTGDTVTLASWNKSGWGVYLWNNGATTSSIDVLNIHSSRTYSVIYTSQGGRKTQQNFHICVSLLAPSLSVDGGAVQKMQSVVVNAGQSVELMPLVPSGKESGSWSWSNGAVTRNLQLANIQSTGHYTVTYTYKNESYTQDFHVYMAVANKPFANGEYYIKNASNGKYLTNNALTLIPLFQGQSVEEPASQVWTITKDGARYKIVSNLDSRFLNEHGVFSTNPYYTAWNSYTLYGVEDGDLYAIRNGGSSGTDYWSINSNGTLTGKSGTTLNGYPFEIVSVNSISLQNEWYRAVTDAVDLQDELPENVHVYPNPIQDYLIVYLSGNIISKARLIMYSADGNIVKTASCAAGETIIGVDELPKGVYYGVLTLDGQKNTIKIIKN